MTKLENKYTAFETALTRLKEAIAKEIYRNIITQYYDILIKTKNKVKSVN